MRFTGHERDLWNTTSSNDDLDYMHARHYNPQLGRFLQIDPLAGSVQAPQTLNRYAYVSGNPLAFTDPSGMNMNSIGCTMNVDTSHIWVNDWPGEFTTMYSFSCTGGGTTRSEGPFDPNHGPGTPTGSPNPTPPTGGPEDPPEDEPCTEGPKGPTGYDISGTLRAVRARRDIAAGHMLNDFGRGVQELLGLWVDISMKSADPAVWNFKHTVPHGPQNEATARFGNFHVGAVGQAAGVPRAMILIPGGGLEVWKKFNDPGRRIGSAGHFFERPEDVADILIGYDMAERGCLD
jgi:RHS repeat-associated protein